MSLVTLLFCARGSPTLLLVKRIPMLECTDCYVDNFWLRIMHPHGIITLMYYHILISIESR